MRRKKVVVTAEPYDLNDDIYVQYELEFDGDMIKPGDIIRFKNTVGTFRFRLLAHNVKLDKTWIDCTDNKTGEFRAFHVEKLKTVVRPKKSRAKKQNV